MISLFKDSFLHPEKIGRAKNLSKGKAFLYLLLLSLILIIPLSLEVIHVMEHLDEDGQEIAARIPDFSIQNGSLTVPHEMNSYVHHTETLTFFFDPNGELTTSNVDETIEQSSSFIGVAMLEDQIYINASLYTFTQSFDQFETLTPQQLRAPFEAMGEMGTVSAIGAAVVLWLFGLINLSVEILIFTLFSNVLASLNGVIQRFGETWKIITVASTLPTVFFVVLELFGLAAPFQLEIKALIVLILFFMAIQPYKSKK